MKGYSDPPDQWEYGRDPLLQPDETAWECGVRFFGCIGLIVAFFAFYVFVRLVLDGTVFG